MATEEKRMRQLIGSSDDWAGDPLVLGDGEVAIERTAEGEIRIKIGDGASTFDALAYALKSLLAESGNDLYTLNSGRLGVGTDSPVDQLTVYGGDYTIGSYRAEIVTDGQNLGIVSLGALSEGATLSPGALIRGQAVGNWSVSNYGAEITFHVTPETATSAQKGATLRSDKGFSVEGDHVAILTTKTPASAADTGYAGQVCWDADYLYVCVATDTWKRAALATW